jgi:hypothetical protein
MSEYKIPNTIQNKIVKTEDHPITLDRKKTINEWSRLKKLLKQEK